MSSPQYDKSTKNEVVWAYKQEKTKYSYQKNDKRDTECKQTQRYIGVSGCARHKDDRSDWMKPKNKGKRRMEKDYRRELDGMD